MECTNVKPSLTCNWRFSTKVVAVPVLRAAAACRLTCASIVHTTLLVLTQRCSSAGTQGSDGPALLSCPSQPWRVCCFPVGRHGGEEEVQEALAVQGDYSHLLSMG